MGWQELVADLEKSWRQLDQQIEHFCEATNQNRSASFCKKGCCNCCSLAVNCSFPEALVIASKLTSEQRLALADKVALLRNISLQAEDLKHYLRLFRHKIGGCPFLEPDTGSCSIYSIRPFSCRALISTRNSSWCAVDFGDLHPQEKEAFLSSLDPEVVAFPTHYLAAPQELGLELEAYAMVAMRETFGVALSGNLLYQIWLETEHQLSEVIPKGFVATLEFLEEKQLDLPFLLQLQGSE